MENITKIYLGLLIIAAVSLIAVDTVSANTYYAEDYPLTISPSYSSISTNNFAFTSGGLANSMSSDYNRIAFQKIENFEGLYYLAYFSEYWDTGFVDDDSVSSGQTSFTCSGAATGSGSIDYFIFRDAFGNPSKIRIQLSFDTFDIGTSTGAQVITLSFTKASINDLAFVTPAYKWSRNIDTPFTTDDNNVAVGGYSGAFMYSYGDYYTVTYEEFDHEITVTNPSEGLLNFDIERNGYHSDISMVDGDSFTYLDDYSTNDIIVNTYTQPITLNITDPYDNTYLNYFYSRSGSGTNYYSVSYDDQIYAYDDFNLVITPLTGAPSLSGLDYFSIQCWNEADASPTGLYYENQAGTWYKWNGDTSDYDIEVPNPYNPDTSNLFTEPGDGEIKIEIFTNTGDRVLNHDGEITVLESANYATYRFLVYDGASNHFIHYPEINVYNQDTDTWDNETPEYGNDVEVKLSKTNVYDILIQKTGYADWSLDDIHPYSDQTKYVYLYPEGNPDAAGHEYITFSVYDGMSMLAIDGAAVTCNGTTKQTVDGYARFEVADNTEYNYSVTKTGYIGKDGSVEVVTDPVVVHISMVAGATPTPTATLPTDRPLTDAEREQAKEGMRDLFYVYGPTITQLALVGAVLFLLKSWGR